MRDNASLGLHRSSPLPARIEDLGDEIQRIDEKLRLYTAGKDIAAGALACVNDPAKDCVLCSRFDECAYADRESSLMSIALALVLGAVALATTIFLMME